MQDDAVLKITNLNTYFQTPDGNVSAVCDVDIEIKKGEIVGLIGETGCGKSVLGESVLKVLPYNAIANGSILFENSELMGYQQKQMRQIRGRKIAVIPQNPSEALNPLIKNKKQIYEAIDHNDKVKGTEKKKQALRLLQKMHFKEPEKVLDSYPHRLSGGMKQRILAAMGLCGNPSLLIADEPTKGLDAIVRSQVIETLMLFKENTGTAMMLITHDLNFAIKVCDRIAVMYAGELIEVGSSDEIFNNPLHPYLMGLFLAQPENGLIPIEGASPSLINLPPGCRFHDRCEKASEKCERFHPEMKKTTLTHEVRCWNL
ncbi:ABC transporter ATP-binding protein [Acetobacterium sp.]|jgi:peptide/nickel transport system ATP-binding protein|uniref:ABC transporter ATP-binding protein n=1 Tax=Acetobacterium sp. TaxID=1872094 RepID=UPI000CB3F58F|nr:ABC transporter ATP-binding protein [Acetobacterium sp.]MDO9492345.1 ABC transporter ATP-binding protein [Acetobacterium sp.]PKM74546.1 MAG: ABC transporter ATP-binding protein [Firmicutes bacterium HGW-Firmicutes-17]